MKGYVAVLAVAALFAACGAEASPEQQIESTLKDYMAAVADGDGEAACALLTPGARADMELRFKARGLGETCEALSKDLDEVPADQREGLRRLKDAEVTDIKVTGVVATAVPTLDGERGNEVELYRIHDEWKVNDAIVTD